jgi:hypothetical protein
MLQKCTLTAAGLRQPPHPAQLTFAGATERAAAQPYQRMRGIGVGSRRRVGRTESRRRRRVRVLIMFPSYDISS